MISMLGDYKQSERVLAAAVRAAINGRGIPTTPEAASALAGELHPALMDQRGYLAANQARAIRRENPVMVIPPVPQYPEAALDKLVRRSAGLTPNADLAQIEAYDPDTQEMTKTSVPLYAYPGEERLLQELNRRLTAGLSRHARSASRDLVTATARANGTRWARQLSGAENCGFCAMLASRGAVYGSDQRARFTAHDNCDCTATIVAGDHYEGVDQAAALRELWQESAGLADFTKRFREEKHGFMAA